MGGPAELKLVRLVGCGDDGEDAATTTTTTADETTTTASGDAGAQRLDLTGTEDALDELPPASPVGWSR